MVLRGNLQLVGSPTTRSAPLQPAPKESTLCAPPPMHLPRSGPATKLICDKLNCGYVGGQTATKDYAHDRK